ncbi:hypothetical protein D3Z53_01905 [Lachnospiraceae bacterium]|jgi:hypothetical protein|nr:hypothetical protein [uncultured Schaedlerella sp.]NBI56843.1 hypothetical protein [Lachnospiraceae bacterium]
MGEDIILCQREIRRLRCVVRTYEAQMRELESYLGQMAENPLLGDEAGNTVREIFKTWKRILED